MTPKILPDTCFREKIISFKEVQDLNHCGASCAAEIFLPCSVLGARWPQSCLTLCNCMDHDPPGFSVHGLCQEEYSPSPKKKKKKKKKKKTYKNVLKIYFFWSANMFNLLWLITTPGGTRGKEATCQCKRCKRLGFAPWIGSIPWIRQWQPTLVFLPEKFHGGDWQAAQVDYIILGYWQYILAF